MSARRNRLLDAINHRQPDQVPVDFGATTASGIHCSVVAELRDRLGLEKRPVRVHEPYQMLGYIEEDLREALAVDTATVMPISTYFGNAMNREWKEWRTPWGQVVLIPKSMEVETQADGSVVTFPKGDRSARPSGKMPASGYFFDALERQGEYDEDNPDPRDNAEEFVLLSDQVLADLAREAKIARDTGYAVVGILPGTGLGSASAVPAMSLANPKGVRSVADWYMALAALPEFVKGIYEIQTEVALKNLERIHRAVGDNYDVAWVCGSDFGTQQGTMIAKCTLEELFCPYYRRINAWIHQHTKWKTFKHTCGAVEPLIEPLIAAGFDILNPVQCSAAGMEPAALKKKYGDRIVFWGGGVDTQQTLPFGSPAEVREQVLERCRIFSPGGGFVFNTIHNIQALTPLDNVMALFAAVREFNAAGK